jgi:uncharacterized protein
MDVPNGCNARVSPSTWPPVLVRNITRIRIRAALAATVAGAAASPAASFAQSTRPAACVAQQGAPQPIIDVHMHAVGAGVGSAPIEGDTAALHAVIAELDRRHVIAVVTSSLVLSRTLQWVRRDSRFIATLAFRDTAMSVDTVRALLQRGTVQGLGELGFQYAGLRPDEPALDKYFAIAEELDVPVAIHLAGGGLPDVPAFRARLGDPLLLEEVLVRHPRLRVNIMHAGLPYLEGTLAIMRRYPQVYADLSKISDSTAYPREQFHDYLRALMRANLGKRLMFGSDAAGPGAVTEGLEGITSAAFLTASQRRDILCDNAARFYRLGNPSKASGDGSARRPAAANKRVTIINDYSTGLAGVHAANPDVKLRVDRDAALGDESVLFVGLAVGSYPVRRDSPEPVLSATGRQERRSDRRERSERTWVRPKRTRPRAASPSAGSW